MYSTLCAGLKIEYPIFAFSHSADVVVAASRAGAMGVLGAADLTIDQLSRVLDDVARRLDGAPFGVDFVVPAAAIAAPTATAIPEPQMRFANLILAEHDVAPASRDALDGHAQRMLDFLSDGAHRVLEIALDYPISLLATALGPPPPDIVARARKRGITVAGLAGTAGQARKHVDAGASIIIAQGGEAGGHTGEIATMVVVPQVVDAVHPVPVVAAGGIASGRQAAAAMALGAQGVWMGSAWLLTAESNLGASVRAKIERASSRDAVISRSVSGKPQRMLRSAWTESWERSDAPSTLPMPLQTLVSAGPLARALTEADLGNKAAGEVVTYPAGQVIGSMSDSIPTARLIGRVVAEFDETVRRQHRFQVSAPGAATVPPG